MIGDWWAQFNFGGEEFAEKLMADSVFQEIVKECAVMWTMGGQQGWSVVMAMIGAAYCKGLDMGAARVGAGKLFDLLASVADEP